MGNKYLLGSEKEFDCFLNSISSEDKIRGITHVDLDGISSMIFLQEILESKGLKLTSIDFLDHGADVLKNFSKRNNYDILFLTDWAVDNYLEDLKQLREKGRVFVIDHHPINEKLKDKSGIIKTDYSYCSSQCLFDLAKNYIDTKKFRKLVCAAMIKDYVWDKTEENFQFINSIYPEIKKDSILNSEPARIGDLIDGALIYYEPDFKKVYDLVLKDDFSKMKEAKDIISNEINEWIEKFKKEAEYFSEKNLRFYCENPKYHITSKITSILSSQYFPKDTIVFVSDMKEEKGSYKVSSRNQTGKFDLGKILKKSIEGFEGAVAGGHARASGGSFPKKYLDKFKENLLREL